MVSNRKRPEPKPGDLIEIFYGSKFAPPAMRYQHWAVYVGDGYVVHVTNVVSGISGVNSVGSPTGCCAQAVVKKELLSKVVEGYEYRINNIHDGKRQARSPEEIIQMALERVGEEWSYSVTHKNCEHFVTELRYGEPICEQVGKMKWHWGGVIANVALAVVVLVLL